MNAAYHTTSTVLPGHKIEITAPDLGEGQQVQAVVIPVPASQPRRQGPSALDIIESYKGPGVFASAEDVDRHINEERDSWGR